MLLTKGDELKTNIFLAEAMKFKDILESHPKWGAEKSGGLLTLMDINTIRSEIEDRLEKEARIILQKERSASLGLMGVKEEDAINSKKPAIRDMIEEAVYSEKMEEVKKHPFYVFIIRNQNFANSMKALKRSRKSRNRGSKTQFYVTLSLYIHLMDYIHKIKKQKSAESISKGQVTDIVQASKALKTSLEPCSNSLDFLKYQAVMNIILDALEESLSQKIKKKSRADKTALKREFSLGLSKTLFYYLDDFPSTIIHILCGVIDYDIDPRIAAEQTKIAKKLSQEEKVRFSAFIKKIHTAILIDN